MSNFDKHSSKRRPLSDQGTLIVSPEPERRHYTRVTKSLIQELKDASKEELMESRHVALLCDSYAFLIKHIEDTAKILRDRGLQQREADLLAPIRGYHHDE